VTKVAELRGRIREADESISNIELHDLWNEAQVEVGEVRLFADLVLAAFFGGEKPREREIKRTEYAGQVVRGEAGHYRGWLDDRRYSEIPLAPFHWEIEFPEVFDRRNPGFDAIVGNPPFAGKNSMVAANVNGYPEWLKHLHEESHGNADLVAHFFRRAFYLIREGGAFGLIATNTIAQGDTRSTGLRWICEHSGEIFAARKRVKWPGLAAVVVSVLHVMKGRFLGSRRLDGREVGMITAFLFHRGGHEDPARLAVNNDKSFVGSYVLGMGFTFDDTDKKGVATSLAEMQRLIDKDAHNQEVIFPYIGGEEINASPTHAHHRYVINFGEMSEEEARRWPDLMAIVEEKVKPGRMLNNREVRKKYWWRFGESTPALFAAIAGLKGVLVISRVGQQAAFALVRTRMVYSDSLIVFPVPSYAAFCSLQSRPHEIWARFFASSMKDDLRYTPSDCFETFAFPENWQAHPDLETAGKAYYEFRAALTVRNNEGLTKTYNRFHDPDEADSEIIKLRELHAAMDRAVLDTYGWSDISTHCAFTLDYEIDEEEWGDKKKPWRYRWPDDVRDEVLVRLLELNVERAKEEARSGAAAANKGSKKGTAKRSSAASTTEDLFA